MARFAVKTLEFDKVKNMLASKAATFLGKQAIISLQIESEFSKVKRLQEETAEALRILDEGRRFPFGGAFNITADVKRAELGSVLEPEELQHIQTTVQAFASMKDFTAENAETAPNLAEYGAELTQFSRLEKQIGSAIDEHGEIKDNASPKLGGLRTAIQIAKNRVKEKLDSILHDPNNQKYFMDNIVTMRGDRYVIPVKQEYKMNFPGIVHDQSGTGATLFIEPLAVVNLNNDIKRYVAEEHEEIERILRQLTQNVGAEAKALLASLEIFTTLDVICARALLAQEQHAVRPMLVLSGGVEIAQGRHPLLPKDTVVPLDVQLGDKFTMLLITGPNTGGKTVALKAVGLFALMAQIGLFIPASSAKLPVFRAVYADIGDEQSIEQSLSTFSSHMKNIVYILKKADSNSLVIFDELCAGTDPTEGAALAISILRTLHSKKITTIATTHYSELKIYALSTDGVENACCEFDVASLAPTYRLLIGIPGKSNAFAISGKLGLPSEIIENAKANIGTSDKAFEDVISDLEKSRVTIEKEQAEIELYKKEIEELKNRLKIKTERLDEKSDSIIEKAREEADAILREAKETADETIRDFNKAAKNGMTIQDLEAGRERIRKQLEKTNAKKAANKPVQTSNHTAADFHIGDKVHVISMDLDGTVHTLPDSKGFLTVSMGILNSKVNIKDLIILKEASETEKLNNKKSGIGKLKMNKTASISPEINLIGMTSDEAIIALDKYLDDAFLAHISPVRIVHGKGSGVLRNAVHNYLKRQKHVKSFRLGTFGEGDYGVTIAEFKD